MLLIKIEKYLKEIFCKMLNKISALIYVLANCTLMQVVCVILKYYSNITR